MLKENLADVEAKIVKACENSGRQRDDVTLIAVSKTKPVETLKDAYDLGVRVFGENKVDVYKRQPLVNPGLSRQWTLTLKGKKEK